MGKPSVLLTSQSRVRSSFHHFFSPLHIRWNTAKKPIDIEFIDRLLLIIRDPIPGFSSLNLLDRRFDLMLLIRIKILGQFTVNLIATRWLAILLP